MIVVRDCIRDVGKLTFEAWLLPLQKTFAHVAKFASITRGAMLQDSLTRLEHQVQARKVRVLRFEFIDDAQRLQIVLEAPEVLHALVEGILAGMAEGCMPEVMRKTDRLDQRLVQLHGPGNRSGDLRDLQRMRQPGAIEIAFVIDEYLGLVDEPAEGRLMDDPIAVALVLAAVNGVRLAVAPASRS